MLVPLIPVILAANINATGSEWKHGAEVIFDARMEGWTPPIDATGQSMIFNTTIKVTCRPVPDTTVMRCLFGDATVVVTLRKPSGQTVVIRNYTRTNEPPLKCADIHMSKDGLGRHGVDRCHIPSSRFDVQRVFFNELNVTIDWTRAPGEYDIDDELTILGTCRTKLVVLSSRANPDYHGDVEPYRMVITPESRDAESEVLSEFKRIRDVDSCYLHILSNGRFDRRLKSSVTHTIITKGGYTSSTETEAIYKDNWDKTDTGRIARERITMSFEKIVPATEPLPTHERLPSQWVNSRVHSFFHSDKFTFIVGSDEPEQYYLWWQAAGKNHSRYNDLRQVISN